MIKISHIQFASPVRVGSSTNNNHLSTKHNRDMLIEWDGETKFHITHLPSKKKIIVFSTNVAFAELAGEASEVTSGRLSENDSVGVSATEVKKPSRRKKSTI